MITLSRLFALAALALFAPALGALVWTGADGAALLAIVPFWMGFATKGTLAAAAALGAFLLARRPQTTGLAMSDRAWRRVARFLNVGGVVFLVLAAGTLAFAGAAGLSRIALMPLWYAFVVQGALALGAAQVAARQRAAPRTEAAVSAPAPHEEWRQAA